MDQSKRSARDRPGSTRAEPRYRPLERYWPYAELSDRPSEEELLALHPELREALFGPEERPFSITLAFPRFEGPDYERAVELARSSDEYTEMGRGPGFRVRARFGPTRAADLRNLYEIVGRLNELEVLIDDKPLPHARELWLPLVWFFIGR